MNLKGKNAIITGGGSGLGKAVAIALANEGVNIGITGRNEENLKNTAEEIKKFKIDGNCYEIYGLNKEGKKVEIYFDMKTLGIVKAEGIKD